MEDQPAANSETGFIRRRRERESSWGMTKKQYRAPGIVCRATLSTPIAGYTISVCDRRIVFIGSYMPCRPKIFWKLCELKYGKKVFLN
jgi:hypothetical protein